MDLSLTPEQAELQRTVRRVIDARAQTSPLPVRTYDDATMKALDEAGLMDVIASGGTALDAELVVEEAARHGITAPVAATVLVAPLVLGANGTAGKAVALMAKPESCVTRFGAQADQYLVIDGDEAVVAAPGDVKVEPVDSRWGYPLSRVTLTGGRRLGAGSAQTLRQAWRIAIAAEAGGLVAASVARAAEHVSTRFQFGRPIGGYQAVQHRLARAKVVAEGTILLARRAAWDPQHELNVMMAATFAAEGMRESLPNCQQVCGAIGITDEFGLTRTTMKMAYLATELGGGTAHARDYARTRYLANGTRRPAPGFMGRGKRP